MPREILRSAQDDNSGLRDLAADIGLRHLEQLVLVLRLPPEAVRRALERLDSDVAARLAIQIGEMLDPLEGHAVVRRPVADKGWRERYFLVALEDADRVGVGLNLDAEEEAVVLLDQLVVVL